MGVPDKPVGIFSFQLSIKLWGESLRRGDRPAYGPPVYCGG
jgi:hypothetical protein